MAWLIPALLFAAAVVFWRLSFHTDEYLVAWFRFGAACVFAFFATVLGAVELLKWMMS